MENWKQLKSATMVLIFRPVIYHYLLTCLTGSLCHWHWIDCVYFIPTTELAVVPLHSFRFEQFAVPRLYTVPCLFVCSVAQLAHCV